MSLTTLLVLIAAAACLAAMAVQVRSFTDDQREFSRRRRRVGLAFGTLLLVLGLVHAIATGTWRPRFFIPEEDGSWGAMAIDGMPVPSDEYRILIRDGRVLAGRDGCNDWSYTDEPPGPDGERMIVSTMVACFDNDPIRSAYWAVAQPDPILRLYPDGTLLLKARGHEATFGRCTWVKQALPRGTSGSLPDRCVVRAPKAGAEGAVAPLRQ